MSTIPTPYIHFAHGNGFPSPCYLQLLYRLKEHYPCFSLDRIGHNKLYPVTQNWSYLVEELINNIIAVKQPVIAVGHSLGGVLSTLACLKRPELFQAVILLDAPMLGRFKSKLLRLSKILRLIDNITPAGRTQKRQQYWQSREEALSYFQKKTLFKHFTPECLADYIDYGLEQDENGYKLWFDREIEYQIYRTLPHQLYYNEGRLVIPCYLIHGEQSKIIKPPDINYMLAHYLIKAERIPGTHMFPMEYPEETAAKIIELIQAL